MALVATALAYAPSLVNGYAMDDRLVALGINDAGQPTPRVFELRPLGEYFTTSYWADSRADDRLYRPATTLSFALRHRLFGDAAWPEHAANLLLHLAATALVFALLCRLAAPPAAAAAGAALFGLHAIHSEVVATVVGRPELGGFVGGALAALLVLIAEARGGRQLALRGGAALSLLTALLFKENAVGWLGAIPALVLAARAAGNTGTAAPSDERDELRILRVLARLAAVLMPPLALFLLLRQNMIASLSAPADPVLFLVNPLADAAPWTRLATATLVLAYGALLTFAPFRLAADYGAHFFPIVGSFAHPLALVAAALLATLAGAAWRVRRKAPELIAAAAIFFAGALPTANLLFPIGTIFGERLYYAPSLALALVGAWAVGSAARRGRTAPVALLLGLWLGASTLVIVERNGVWRDDATLFLHEADHQLRSARMQLTAASVLGERGERESAIHRVERALALEPELALAWNNLAALQLDQGRLAEAEAAARRGLEARHRSADDEFKLRANLGLVLGATGNADAAAAELARALALEPGFVRAWQELVLLVRAGAIPAATLPAAVAAVESAGPGIPYSSLYRGLARLEAGELESAEAELAIAVASVPRRGPWAAAWAEGALARADLLLRRGRADEGRALLAELAGDRFTPAAQREVAAAALAALGKRPRT